MLRSESGDFVDGFAAIETYRKQQQQQEWSEEISSEGPILEEFIPLRPSCSSSNEENINRTGNSNGFDKIPDWLRSVQLWNQQPDPKGVGFFIFNIFF